MEAKTVEVEHAQSQLRELVALVGTGTEVVLTEENTPIARLVPIAARALPRVPGLHQGAMTPGDDFNAPLPEAFWTTSI